MDLLMNAIVAGLTMLGQTAAKDGYNALKNLLCGKAKGEEAGIEEALAGLEAKPDSPGRRLTLKEELTACGADRDEEILRVARELLETVGAQPGGEQVVQQVVTGNRNIFSGTGDVKVHFGSPDAG